MKAPLSKGSSCRRCRYKWSNCWRVRGLKVRLTSTARVEGDIIHKTIAIESGAHFEGSVQRQDDPINQNAKNSKNEATSPDPSKMKQVSANGSGSNPPHQKSFIKFRFELLACNM